VLQLALGRTKQGTEKPATVVVRLLQELPQTSTAAAVDALMPPPPPARRL
jgi:hypothetical protein